jgi:hypothetical protein
MTHSSFDPEFMACDLTGCPQSPTDQGSALAGTPNTQILHICSFTVKIKLVAILL